MNLLCERMVLFTLNNNNNSELDLKTSNHFVSLPPKKSGGCFSGKKNDELLQLHLRTRHTWNFLPPCHLPSSTHCHS
ncbi:hypothetical protein PRUPE_8G053600 [Prunus persica]|uniref:Uncharacterized protein n=1 Tax=Prunus persica TaxID=3760 RepID=A0A251MTK9_PRUPE|nr:hypothetical protein PRUPE_8G053600 [Prunus persica]